MKCSRNVHVQEMFKHVPLWFSLGSGRGGPDLWPNRQARPRVLLFVLVFSFVWVGFAGRLPPPRCPLRRGGAVFVLFLVGLTSSLVVCGGWGHWLQSSDCGSRRPFWCLRCRCGEVLVLVTRLLVLLHVYRRV